MRERRGYVIRNQFGLYFVTFAASGIVDQPEAYLHSSSRNYSERMDYLIEVEVLDFGVQEGLILL